MSVPLTRISRWAALTAGLALLLGCGLGSNKGGPKAVDTPSNPETTASTGTVTANCAATDLSITPQEGSSGSTHRSVILVFTNTSGHPCWLKGYPAVAGLDAGHAAVASASLTPHGYLGGIPESATAAQVDLAAGDSASSLVEALAINEDGTSCTPYAAIAVTPPGTTTQVTVAWPSDGCSALESHPVVPGTSGSSS